ncbi:MAG: methylenetetrahydrofolate--tRNA-(uracil(54)-C(5))-methyltransferase (FADH(2)-oxidizing) TrmFO [Bacteriovoracaceae bacterium]
MDNIKNTKVLVIGAGLAGSDAAYFLASKGVEVFLIEGKSLTPTPAQTLKTAAELVCTNSLKSFRPNSAHGLLKSEMEKFGSLVLKMAYKSKVPAGDSLSVDRTIFSELVHNCLVDHPLINFVEENVTDPMAKASELGCENIIIATGPLTTEGLEKWIIDNISKDDFYFYDAIAPIVDADSLDLNKMYFKDRYKDSEGEEADYLNVPLNKQEYIALVQDLKTAEIVQPKNFEKPNFFEACLPVDIMAKRGEETLRFGCMKPVGLEMPDGERPYAVIQLRRENLQGDAYNMVGFQNRLTYGEQLRVFRKLPGFENASFNHLGSVHRNSFLNSQKLLNFDLSSKEYPNIYFAGQITGVEGYTESASMGLYVGYQILRKIKGLAPKQFPTDTGIGALVNYIMTATQARPSNINFGLLPKVDIVKKKLKRSERKTLKKDLASQRALESMDKFLSENSLEI